MTPPVPVGASEWARAAVQAAFVEAARSGQPNTLSVVLALALDAARSSGRDEAAKAVAALDELAVTADWDNSDDIAHAVKTACLTAIRAGRGA